MNAGCSIRLDSVLAGSAFLLVNHRIEDGTALLLQPLDWTKLETFLFYDKEQSAAIASAFCSKHCGEGQTGTNLVEAGAGCRCCMVGTR